jgi:3-oxoacyl-[acyl-carrier-protein] synthase-3
MNSILKNISIRGISAAVPKKIYRNKKYPNFGKSGYKKFYEYIGIQEKRVADKNIFTSTLVYAAAKQLLKTIKWKKNTVEILILITQTPDFQTPSTSIKLQNELGLNKNIIAFDINLGCSGFPYGIAVISSLMNNLNISRGILLIGDTMSKVCNFNDKSTYPLFGDAGAAVAIERSLNDNMFFNFYSDGSSYKDIIIPSCGLSGRFLENENEEKKIILNTNLHLNGPNVYSFAINEVPKTINVLLEKNKLRDKIHFCFLHQANKLINENIQKKLLMKNVIFPQSFKLFGNTSCATIPLTMVLNKHLNYSNKNIFFSGFGVGSSISNAIIKIKKNILVNKIIQI